MINSRTDCYVLAKEVIYQCDLIHHSRLSEVEQTIYYLKKRKLAHIATSLKGICNYSMKKSLEAYLLIFMISQSSLNCVKVSFINIEY